MKLLIRIAILCLCLCGATRGADSPRFRGPAGDGCYPETGLLKTWPADGPRQVWSVDGLGAGWSSASVAGERVYVTGMDADMQGWLFAFNLDGKPLWKKKCGIEPRAKGYPGTRATPTVDEGRLYVMSGNGELFCFNAKTGAQHYRIDLLKKYNGKRIPWALAESVHIHGDTLICTPGGPNAALVALDKTTGRELWKTKSLSAAAAYCTPALARHGGRHLIVTQVKGLLAGVDADTGNVLWTVPFAHRHGVKPTTPIYHDGMIYATAGRRVGSVLLKLSADGAAVTEQWRDATLDCQHHQVVRVDGYIYGTAQTKKGLVCLDWKTGKAQWHAREPGQAAIAYADGRLYVYTDKGELLLVDASPAAYRVVSRLRIEQGTGKHWAHPTIAGRRIYLRHGDTLTVYDIAEGQK